MSKASLMRKLVKLEYKDGGSMVVHLNDFQGLINQLSPMSMSRCREDFRQWCEKHIRRTKSSVNNIKQ